MARLAWFVTLFALLACRETTPPALATPPSGNGAAPSAGAPAPSAGAPTPSAASSGTASGSPTNGASSPNARASAPPIPPLPPALPPFPLDESLLTLARTRRAAVESDLATLVNLDSGTDDAEGLAHVAEFVARRLKALGATVAIEPAPPSAGKLVRATLRGTGTKKILLLAHLDTVFPRGEAGRRPFRIEGTRARGPGVADDKGGVALVLAALAVARERGFRGYDTLSVLFDPDEEKGSPGARELIRTLSSQHDVVLSFEPPDGDRVIVATNGIAFVKLDVKGRAAHAGSAPEQGRNAALELAHQLLALSRLGDASKGTTVNFTLLQAGDRVNVIPERASATADMRFSDANEIERVKRDAERITREHLVPDTEVSVSVDPRRPPLPRNPGTDRLAELARRITAELGRPVEPVSMRYGTDAGFAYEPNLTSPAVLEGLGIVGAGLHSADEWADLESIVPRLYLAVHLLETLGTEGMGR